MRASSSSSLPVETKSPADNTREKAVQDLVHKVNKCTNDLGFVSAVWHDNAMIVTMNCLSTASRGTALKVAGQLLDARLPVQTMQKSYPVFEGELQGPRWEFVFYVPNALAV